jgi:hypothetical protein
LAIQRMRNTIATLERKIAGHVTFADIVGKSQPLQDALAQERQADAVVSYVFVVVHVVLCRFFR